MLEFSRVLNSLIINSTSGSSWSKQVVRIFIIFFKKIISTEKRKRIWFRISNSRASTGKIKLCFKPKNSRYWKRKDFVVKKIKSRIPTDSVKYWTDFTAVLNQRHFCVTQSSINYWCIITQSPDIKQLNWGIPMDVIFVYRKAKNKK